MRPTLSALSCVVVFLLFAPLVVGQPLMLAHQVFTCTNQTLTINRTSIIDGNYKELFFDNQTCGSMGCAYNGIECNSPMNVDRLGAVVSALIFMVAGVLFFVFGMQLKETTKLFYALKYLHIFVAFSMFLFGILLVWGLYTLGQNEITDTYFLGFMMLLVSVLVTAFSLGVHELYGYLKRLNKIGRSI